MVEVISSEVMVMALGMQIKLNENRHKGGWLKYDEKGNRIWDQDMLEFLKSKVVEELSELFEALRTGTPTEIYYEACDLANIAMMLTDINGGLDTLK